MYTVFEAKIKSIVIKSEEERLVYAEVYSPLHVDSHGETMTADQIRKSAHNFLANGFVSQIDVGHNLKKSGCVVVESYIAKKGDADGFIEGSWVVGIYVSPDDIWEGIKKGDINGLSLYGRCMKTTVQAEVLQTKQMIGETEDSLVETIEKHSHEMTIAFDENDKIIPARTSAVLGHSHLIKSTTATEEENGHSHRITVVEN